MTPILALGQAAADTGSVVAWHPHLDTLGVVVALALFYELGLRRLHDAYAPRGEESVTRKQRITFYAGIVTLFVATSWPIHDIGEQSLFMFHMIEHLTVALIVPPLLLWGTPWWLLRAVLLPVMPVVKLLTKPIVALFLFNAMLGLIHVPAVLEAMLTSDVNHIVIHALLLFTATLMWWPVIGPIPDTDRLPPFLRMGYLFLQSLVPTIPASFLTLGDEPLYKIYETFPRLWGISAHTDQVLAGFIMKFGGGFILWAGITTVFFRWYNEEQKYTGMVDVDVKT
jgi:putative membrane protein